MRHPAPLAALLLLAACQTPGARPFSFHAAEFLPGDRGEAAARAFLDSDVPAGAPVTLAVERLRAAGMSCRSASGARRTLCDYYWPVHMQGGLIGEDHYEVQLDGDGSGRVAGARLERYFVGSGMPSP